ncbi:hypothetical protein AALB51_15440, partial [Lachnospiraceae bacterium 62-26]
RLCFFSGKVGDYKVPFKSTRKCRSTPLTLVDVLSLTLVEVLSLTLVEVLSLALMDVLSLAL